MTLAATRPPRMAWLFGRLTARLGREPVESALFAGLLAGLAWAPFYLGGNRLIAWGVDALLFAFIAAIYEISLLARRQGHPVGARRVAAPLALFALAAGWIVVQASPSILPSLAHPVWALAADALRAPLEGSISVNPDLTWLALLRLLTEAVVFWLALQLCRDEARALTLVRAVAAIGVGYAAWGLISFAIEPGRVLWFSNPAGKAGVTSTFINRNHYATYAGLGLVCAAGLLLSTYRDNVGSAGGSPRHRLARLIETTGGTGVVLLGGAAVLLAALLLTGSRGGAISAIVGLVTLGLMLFVHARPKASKGRETAVFAGVLGLAGLVLFGDLFFSRLADSGIHDVGRLSVYRIVLDMIQSAPLLGYGYGAFADAFPMFRDRSIGVTGFWDKAHNTYLEMFVGLGLAGGAALLGSILLLVRQCLNGVARRRRNELASAVAVAAAVLVGVHALVDFSVQLQAIAITFAALMGAGVAQSESSRMSLRD